MPCHDAWHLNACKDWSSVERSRLQFLHQLTADSASPVAGTAAYRFSRQVSRPGVEYVGVSLAHCAARTLLRESDNARALARAASRPLARGRVDFGRRRPGQADQASG